MTHIVTIRPDTVHRRLVVDCSCGEELDRPEPNTGDGSFRVTLSQLADLADEHIRRAEQDDRDRRIRAIYG